MSHIRRLLASETFVLSLVLLAGRAAGFLREILIGRTFGLSKEADLAVIFLTLPDLFVGILLAGGLSAALIPKLSSLSSREKSELFWQASSILGLLFFMVALLVAFNPNLLLSIIAPGYVNGLGQKANHLLFIVAFAIPFAALSGVTASLLNSNNRFFWAGSGTLVFNFIVIVGLAVGMVRGAALESLTWGIVAAVIARYAVQMAASASDIDFRWGKKHYDQALMKRFCMALVATSAALLVPVFMRSMATFTGTGNLAAFNYAMKLVELPVGVAITTISTVALPKLSSLISVGNLLGAKTVYQTSTLKSLKVAMAIAIPSMVLSGVFVEILFGQSRFTPDQLKLIADLARIGFLTLPLIAISSMATAALNAQGRQGVLLKWTLISLLVLPIAVLPGIYFESIRLQVCALIAFYIALATSLAKIADFPIFKKIQ